MVPFGLVCYYAFLVLVLFSFEAFFFLIVTVSLGFLCTLTTAVSILVKILIVFKGHVTQPQHVSRVIRMIIGHMGIHI